MELIRRGSVGRAVEDVQSRLAHLGQGAVDEVGRFGPPTEAAVRAFQQERGLPADGIVGPDTWRALVGASFRLGDRVLYITRPLLFGDDVQDLQRRLNRLGFDAGYDDGLFGRQTFDAVREFQLNVGLPIDGIVGSLTVDILKQVHREHQETLAFSARERHQMRTVPRVSMTGLPVMVDPGHGPDDPGATAPNGVPEHVVTWQIASLLQGRLAALGARVVLSRGPSTTPSDAERAELANAEGVEALVSIHVNALAGSEARGAAAYYYGSAVSTSERGRLLAQLFVNHLTRGLGTPDCRTHPSTSSILSASRAVAVKVEPGFLTHADEGIALTQTAHQRVIADALVIGLSEFLLGSEMVGAG
jgi:N-acetylmuramoyl-L-alanine amidase